MNENKLPEHKYKCGNVEGSIWNNKVKDKNGNDINVRSVRIEKKYQDNEGNWKSTTSYNVRDLKDLEIVSNKIYKHIMLMGQKPGGQNG